MHSSTTSIRDNYNKLQIECFIQYLFPHRVSRKSEFTNYHRLLGSEPGTWTYLCSRDVICGNYTTNGLSLLALFGVPLTIEELPATGQGTEWFRTEGQPLNRLCFMTPASVCNNTLRILALSCFP